MYIAVILICGLPQGNMICQAIVNRIPLTTSEECVANVEEALSQIRAGLPYPAHIADYDCVPMSIAG